MTDRLKYNSFKVILLIGLGLSGLTNSGCSKLYQALKFPGTIHFTTEEQRTFETAHDAFRKGDYQKAGDIFDDLAQNVYDRDIRRRSLYGLACVRLTLAETCDDFQQADQLWNSWRELFHQTTSDDEDPGMMAPFIEKIMSGAWLPPYRMNMSNGLDSYDENAGFPVLTEAVNGNLTGKPSYPTIQEQSIDAGFSGKDDGYSKLLHAREKEIRKLKKQIVQMEDAMKVLKKQFKELEEIHQEIQEKKKGILP